jgi:hypothetical protein
VVSSRTTHHVQGRGRRSGIGWLHQRPLKRQTDDRRASCAGSMTARGHSASIAATIAATSCSVGVGVMGGSTGVHDMRCVSPSLRAACWQLSRSISKTTRFVSPHASL